MNKSYMLFSIFPILLLAAWQTRGPVPGPVPEDSRHVVSASLEGKSLAVEPESTEEKDFFSLSEQLSSGERTGEQLEEEWNSWVGHSEPRRWEDLNIKRPHRLTMVLSEFHSLADNPFRVMHIRSFDFSGGEDSTQTLYNRTLSEPDELSVDSELVVSHRIERNGERFELSEAHRKAYSLRLRPQKHLRPYDLREPRVEENDHLRDVDEFDLDVIEKLITEGSGLMEMNLYEREILWHGETYHAQVSLRKTAIETLSIEVQLRRLDSLNLQRFALIYEPI